MIFSRFLIPFGWLPRPVSAGRGLVLAGLMLLSAARLPAHDPGLSTAECRFYAGQLEIAFSFSASDALLIWRGPRGDTAKVAAPSDRRWDALAREWCTVTDGGRRCDPIGCVVKAIAGDGLGFVLQYRVGAGPVALNVRGLDALPRAHREFVVSLGALDEVLAQKFLTTGDSRFAVPIPDAMAVQSATPAAAPASAAAFFRLGVEHIWTGYDHLLFLFGLVIVCRRLRSLVGVISCFTVAHSLSLAAATLGWALLPSRWVESAIAASIIFVGVENLLRGGNEPPWRFVLTFAFGLIHGFGFASALRDLGMGANGTGIIVPLASFNLGVEAGQIVIAAIVLPLLWQLRRWPGFARYGIPVASSLVAAAGTVWFVQRAFLG